MAPLVAFGLLGYPPPDGAEFDGQTLIGLEDLAILLPVAFATMWGMMRLNLPIPYMVGPLLASAGLRLAGVAVLVTAGLAAFGLLAVLLGGARLSDLGAFKRPPPA